MRNGTTQEKPSLVWFPLRGSSGPFPFAAARERFCEAVWLAHNNVKPAHVPRRLARGGNDQSAKAKGSQGPQGEDILGPPAIGARPLTDFLGGRFGSPTIDCRTKGTLIRTSLLKTYTKIHQNWRGEGRISFMTNPMDEHHLAPP